MTQPGQHPETPAPGPVPGTDSPSGAAARIRGPVAVLLAAVAASAILGLLTGLIWSAVAPRALLTVQGSGVAYVVNAETSAYIVADAWFCLLTGIGGVICGVAGYVIAVRRHGAVAVTGLVLGGLAASVLARWVGQQQGLASFRSMLASSRAGTHLHQPLTLGGQGALTFWPLLVALVVGTLELVSQSVERKRADDAIAARAALARPADGDAGR